MQSKSANSAARSFGLTIGIILLLFGVLMLILSLTITKITSMDLLTFVSAIALIFQPLASASREPAVFGILMLVITLVYMVGGAVARKNRFVGGLLMLASALTLTIISIVSISAPVFSYVNAGSALTWYIVVVMLVEGLALIAAILVLAMRPRGPVPYGAAGGYYPGAGQPYSQQPYQYNQYGQPYQNQQAPQQYQYQQPQQPAQQYQYQQPQQPAQQYQQPAPTPMRFDPYTGQPLDGTDTESETPNE